MNEPCCKLLVTCETSHVVGTQTILEESCDVRYLPNPSRSELIEAIGDCDAVLTNLTQRMDREIMEAASLLRLIATPSTGTDHIDMAWATRRDIAVYSLKGEDAFLKTIPSTAEHAFLLMLAILRKLPWAFDSVCAGQWNRVDYRGHEAEGKTVGIVGYGRLGSMFSRFAHAFGMKVIAADPAVQIHDPWVEQVDHDQLYQQADVISWHVHLDDTTRGMVDEKAFALMRTGVYLVNTSRGAIIDECALLHALKSRKVQAAAIDVLADELDGRIAGIPLVAYAKEHDHLLITPHLGGCTHEAQEKSYTYMAKRIIAFFASDLKS